MSAKSLAVKNTKRALPLLGAAAAMLLYAQSAMAGAWIVDRYETLDRTQYFYFNDINRPTTQAYNGIPGNQIVQPATWPLSVPGSSGGITVSAYAGTMRKGTLMEAKTEGYVVGVLKWQPFGPSDIGGTLGTLKFEVNTSASCRATNAGAPYKGDTYQGYHPFLSGSYANPAPLQPYSLDKVSMWLQPGNIITHRSDSYGNYSWVTTTSTTQTYSYSIYPGLTEIKTPPFYLRAEAQGEATPIQYPTPVADPNNLYRLGTSVSLGIKVTQQPMGNN